MKTGRNDPCPCGSGNKFKKCCLGKSLLTAPSSQDARPIPAAASSELPQQTSAWRQSSPTEKLAPEEPSRPSDPLQEKWDETWNEFESQQGTEREAVFLRTLDDIELMNDEAAFEMLDVLHEDAVARGERDRFGRMVEALAERRPELYQNAHYILSWQLLDALADGRPDVLSLTRALAGKAGRDFDVVNRGLAALAYHGQLVPLVEAMRIGWPLVRESNDVMGWAIGEFSEAGASYEMYAYVEEASSPDPSAGELLERIRYFVEDPRLEYVAEFIGDLTGNAEDTWTVADFTLNPPKKQRRRNKRDDEHDEKNEPPVGRGSRNLFRLITKFVGFLRRVEQVPYPRGEFIRHALHGYFIERHRGDLNPRLGMLEQAMHPRKKLPAPPKPSHPLCPERVTFDVCLAQMIGFFSAQHHKAAALFEVIPAWLRFLQSKNLIDDEQRVRSLEELRPLHASVLKLMEGYTQDPTLYRSLKGWPDVT